RRHPRGGAQQCVPRAAENSRVARRGAVMRKTPWSDRELLQFHDQELPESQRQDLLSDLFADAALRERLNRLQAVDELGKAALLQSQSIAPPSRARADIAGRFLWAAASLALIAGGAAVLRWWPSAPAPSITTTPELITVAPARYSDERLVLSIPVASWD